MPKSFSGYFFIEDNSMNFLFTLNLENVYFITVFENFLYSKLVCQENSAEKRQYAKKLYPSQKEITVFIMGCLASPVVRLLAYHSYGLGLIPSAVPEVVSSQLITKLEKVRFSLGYPGIMFIPAPLTVISLI